MALEIYKRSQGKYTRLCTAFALGLIAVLGCYSLYGKLSGSLQNLWLRTMIPTGLFVALAVLIFWLVNKSTVADFMIAAEGEMKKVSWTSRKEIIVSTIIVIIVVIFMAILMGTSDFLFASFFSWLI